MNATKLTLLAALLLAPLSALLPQRGAEAGLRQSGGPTGKGVHFAGIGD